MNKSDLTEDKRSFIDKVRKLTLPAREIYLEYLKEATRPGAIFEDVDSFGYGVRIFELNHGRPMTAEERAELAADLNRIHEEAAHG